MDERIRTMPRSAVRRRRAFPEREKSDLEGSFRGCATSTVMEVEDLAMTPVSLSRPLGLPCLVLALALAVGGCCCDEPAAGQRLLERATAPTAHHVALKLTPLGQPSDEGRARKSSLSP